MYPRPRTGRAGAAYALTLLLLVALASLPSGCRTESRPGANGGAAQANVTPGGGAAAGGAPAPDAAKLDSEIERLERQAERNPADAATRDELARVYVQRGDARRGAGQLREALSDYQSALRLDPDSDGAQAGAAAATEQLGGTQQEDENGAPVPPPISPNVAGEDAKPTPTPRKQ